MENLFFQSLREGWGHLIWEEFKKFCRVLSQELATGFILAPQPLFICDTQSRRIWKFKAWWGGGTACGLQGSSPASLLVAQTWNRYQSPNLPLFPHFAPHLYKHILSLLDLITLSQSCTICSSNLLLPSKHVNYLCSKIITCLSYGLIFPLFSFPFTQPPWEKALS